MSLPADVGDDVDNPNTPAGWLATFGHDHFEWLTDNLDHHPSVRVPQRGRQCYATRIVPTYRAHLEYDRWGLGWYDGWDGVVHDTWVDPRHRPLFDDPDEEHDPDDD